MAIVKIEWEFGKSREDKIIIFFTYYFNRFIQLIFRNYDKIREKDKTPKFTDYNFGKLLYPFILFFVSPLAFIAIAFSKYLSSTVQGVLLTIFLVGTSLFIFVFFISFSIHSITAFFHGLKSFIKSITTTTVQGVNKAKEIASWFRKK